MPRFIGSSATLTPAFGADAGGTDRVQGAPTGGSVDRAALLEAEVGYGLAAFGDAFAGTPYAGFRADRADRDPERVEDAT